MDNPNAALLIACKCKFETCNVNCKITSLPPGLPCPTPCNSYSFSCSEHFPPLTQLDCNVSMQNLKYFMHYLGNKCSHRCSTSYQTLSRSCSLSLSLISFVCITNFPHGKFLLTIKFFAKEKRSSKKMKQKDAGKLKYANMQIMR